MAQIREKRFYYIDSGTQLTSANNTFSYPLQASPSDNWDRVTVMQVNIPISYFMVQSGQNTFTLDENGTLATITVPAGNYNANSWSIIVAGLLNTASPNGYTYKITYPISYTDNNTGMFTYIVNTTSPVSFTVPTLETSTICEQVGLVSGSTNPFTASGGSSTLVSTNVVKFIPEDTIFIHSNLCDAGYNDILQEIYFGQNTVLGNQVFINPCPEMYSKKLVSKNIQLASFTITDERRRPIYLNGLNILITLCFYKDNKFYQLAERYMKWMMQHQMAQLNSAIEEEPTQEVVAPEENV